MKKQFLKYGAVAGASAASDWLIFIVLTSAGISAIAAFAGARVIGGLVSFILNRNWSFKYDKLESCWSHQLLKFIELYVVSYALSIGIYYALITNAPSMEYFMKLVTDSLIFMWNFLIMKFYVFPRTHAFILRGMRLMRQTGKA